MANYHKNQEEHPMLVKRAEEKQPEAQEFSPEELSLVGDIIEKHRAKPGSLIPVLEEIQETIGYLPKMIQRRIALGLNIPFSEVYGVVNRALCNCSDSTLLRVVKIRS